MSDLIIDRDEIKKVSESLEKILRENKQIHNRDKILREMFGQSTKKEDIEKCLNDRGCFSYAFIGKILVKFEGIKDRLNDSKIYRDNTLFYFLEEPDEHIRLTENLEIEKTKTDERLDVNWTKKIQEIKQLKFQLKKNKPNEPGVSFDIFSTNFDGEDQFLEKCKLLCDSKKNNYKKSKYPNAFFLYKLTKILRNRKELDNILGITADKVGEFTILYSISLEDETIKDGCDKMSWSEIKKLKKDK